MRQLFAFLFFIFCFQLGMAQNGTIRGFIYDKATGEPVLFTTVFLKGTNFGVATDVNGYYSLTNIPPGSYLICVTTLGYDSTAQNIDVVKDKVVSKQIYLNKSTVNLKEIDISAEQEAKRVEVKVSVNKITPKEIKIVPSVGADPDLAQYLQVLPGVNFSGDQGGQLYIRGGTPVMNKVLLDGMIIYNPFHSIGLFSVFDTDIISNADVYTGGFNAEYGGRISSIMDISTRDGNKKRVSGKVSASTFSAKLLLEGPIKKQVEGSGSATYVLSYKNSYLDKTSQSIYDYVNNDGLPYSFSDFYGKISLNGQNGSKLNLFGFDFQDNAVYKNVLNTNWKSSGFGSNFLLVPGGSNTLIDGIFSFSRYDIKQQEAQDAERKSAVNGFNFGMNFTKFNNQDEIKYGFEILGFRTEYSASTITGIKKEQIENTTEFGTFFRYRISREKLVIEPSFRIQYYASLAEFSPEPRIGIKWNLSDKFRLKTAAGMYSQNLLSTSSDRDVVNLFYGFLSGPENLPDEFDGKKIDSKLQKSRDIILGFELDIIQHLSLNVEGYYKYFNQLTTVNRDKIYPDNGNYENQPDNLVKEYIIETGSSKGVDFVLKYEFKRLYLWAVYSLGFVERYDGIRTYMPQFDRRHNLNLVGSYTFGAKLNWEFNVRWNYGSGFPFTQTAGFFEYLNFANGLYSNELTENGFLGIDYGEINQGRLPDYHRFDVSLKKTFPIGKNSNLDISASVVNVYNRENIFYFDRIRYTRVNQLPFLPALGASLTF